MANTRLVERLAAIADELDAHTSRAAQLYAERARLWRKGRAQGMTTVELAVPSRVRPVTVSAGTKP